MKMKHKIILFLLLVSVGGVSCKKYLDINSNPLSSLTVEPKLLFGYAITAWDANKNSGDAWLPIGLFGQTIASGGDYGWGKDNVYNVNATALGNTWKVYYSTAGNNLKLAIKNAESANPVDNNTAAQCKIILAQIMYEATTLYGDVPYNQAFDPDKFPYPQYDTQKSVLEAVIALLDEANAQINLTSTLKLTDYDVFYAGDLNKWKKLANSIKFKTLMVMVDKDPSKAAAIGQLLANPSSMISAANESQLRPYYGTTNNENPKFRLFNRYTNGENQWFFANSNVFDYMFPNAAVSDPRIPRYFDKGTNATYKAIGSEVTADETVSLISAYLYRKDAPSVIFSYQELLLLKAEAYARGLGVSQNLATAQGLYREGVIQSCLFYGVSSTDANNFVNTTLPNLTITSDPLRQIHLQQWVDLMDRPMEAFVQWRRSGPEGSEVPALTLPIGATSGALIRRYTLSLDEVAANPNIPNPQPRYFDKMWFDL
ncbi:Starch-binding associating with outer membrane [Pedobacter terrae]|uniref:Starch-binding associating with outer membrane n=1 Tax=Pedobacter terrae TaxID=405671 RepID=A0A1G7R5W4_9SPHI|nr:SusD/RagB family nutrient-binding outer membrane lipoprotein [Pedobacter terrae]SDG06133.1 Starch-binding associating with outer membrane [Pedobacter terrae]